MQWPEYSGYGYIPYVNLDDYNSPDPSRLEKLTSAAWGRDCVLTKAELHAKEEAMRECVLGKNWWLRGHP